MVRYGTVDVYDGYLAAEASTERSMVWYGMVDVHQLASRSGMASTVAHPRHGTYGMVWYGMVEVCEGAPVAVSGWVLTDRHDVSMCS